MNPNTITYTLIRYTNQYTIVTTVPVGGGDLVTVDLVDLESTPVTLVGMVINGDLYLFKDLNGVYMVVR